MRVSPALAAAASVAVALGAAPRADVARHRQSRLVMGSLAEIQVYHADGNLAGRAIGAALDEMQRVDRVLSNYQPGSELSRMNASAAAAPFRASDELYAFVRRCRAYVGETLGTFDPTMGPLVRAWGFFSPQPAPPTAQDAAAARARSGFDKVRLDDVSQTIGYAVPGVEFDPGGIGKGYAADRATAVLREHGITSALVSAGGSTLYALGHPPDQEGWKVAVRNPASPATALRYVLLRDNAISTSGVSAKSVRADGRRFAHIIDPRTGAPGEHVCQVSLVAPSATDSDAWTKAAFLLSRDALERLFAGRPVHVLRIEGGCDDGRAPWTTSWSSGVFVEE
jgi:thiamine biosynthesis lipoprotein